MTRAILSTAGTDQCPTLNTIHGFVLLAHHPALSRARQITTNGPWKA